MKNKIVRAFAQVGSDHYIVKLLDFYLSKLKPQSPFFYMRPLEQIPDDGKPWYTGQRVGINTLKTISPKLSSESGVDVKYTNHSLRATSATRMFTGGVPEKVIAEKTGHRSLQALGLYEKTQLSMEKADDSVIANPCFLDVEKSCKNPADTKAPGESSSTKSETKGKAKLSECIFSGTLTNCTINIAHK